MARIIPTTVCVYVVNPDNGVFHSNHVPRMMKSLLSTIGQPHEIRHIKLRPPYKIKFSHIKPLTRSLNIVIIPDKKFFFDLKTHSESIVLVISVASGNAKYCHGIYCQALTLIRKSLSGEPLAVGTGSMYRRMKPQGRAILVASMVDVENENVFAELYADARKMKLFKRQRYALRHVIQLKKKLYLLNKERLNA